MLRQPIETSLAASADATHEVWDFKDAASEQEELAITELQANRYAMELVEVQAARRRIERGTFGLCVDCGVSIDLPRLMAVPATACCLDCQARQEHPRTAET